ncbi:hypothetical protein KUV46_15580 [Thalassovita mediterranea]|nr:hypothetical protein KUV46_15580 [Thalassovita mediterranea]
MDNKDKAPRYPDPDFDPEAIEDEVHRRTFPDALAREKARREIFDPEKIDDEMHAGMAQRVSAIRNARHAERGRRWMFWSLLAAAVVVITGAFAVFGTALFR